LFRSQFANALAVDADGRIVVGVSAGSTDLDSRFFVARFLPT
jgi:hypothetical protein